MKNSSRRPAQIYQQAAVDQPPQSIKESVKERKDLRKKAQAIQRDQLQGPK
jgi:hypothetical protein